ncbi:MAG: hypothetical protein AAFX87_31305 [Bacteroidota bacterium]
MKTKLFTILAILLFALTFTACNEEEIKPQETPSLNKARQTDHF